MSTCSRPDLFPVSFQGLLNQAYEPLEIVVLVDGSNERSLNLVKTCGDSRVRWISTPQPSGMIPAWNRVCRESKGKYFLFCADDDVLLDKAVDYQVELMERYPNVAFCHADFICVDDNGKEVGRWVSHRATFVDPGLKVWPRYLVGTRCCMQTTVTRRNLWDRVNGWDEDAGNPGDNSLYLKLLRIGDVGHVSHLACNYRIRTNNPDSWEKRFTNLREYYQLATKHLADPPPEIDIPLGILKRKLLAELASRGVSLVTSASDREMKERVRQWLQQYVWYGSGFGQLSQILDRTNRLKFMEYILHFEHNLHNIARRVLYRLASASGRKSLPD